MTAAVGQADQAGVFTRLSSGLILGLILGLAHVLEPFENGRAKAHHADDQHHAERRRQSQQEILQIPSPCGRTDDSAAPSELYHG